MDSNSKPIVVVGAGIIGSTIAYELQKRLGNVVLVDRDPPGMGASYGNMASIAVTEFLPASRPGVWRQLPGWLLDPGGPVRFRPGYLPTLLPWFWRFAAAGRPARLRALEAAGAALCRRALGDWIALLAQTGLSHLLSAQGCLCLYASEQAYRADRDHQRLMTQYELSCETLTGAAARALEPALAPSIHKALRLPDNRSIADPHQLVQALVDRFLGLGGRLETAAVTGFECAEGRVARVLLRDAAPLPVSRVILAAGAFTGRLSALLHEPIPLETERGYHVQLARAGIGMRHSLIWPARAFMVTPTAGGLRIGGTVEMAGLDAPPDYRRATGLLKHARKILPDLRDQSADSVWMGHRPALPDTIPVIGRSALNHNLFYATGHGHLGLTQAATTALLIADLVMDRPALIDLTPYRVDRF
ncbi:NAD(P)/FAD-dependent oxidoreductase [Castellaniella hirudinis]|uniref:NAD(P)/FAD-dependent oxidoreductase n=1 Tax=Castellaniella hirudinis TaxID=1144617 RepID=UPI0039C1A7DB